MFSEFAEAVLRAKHCLFFGSGSVRSHHCLLSLLPRTRSSSVAHVALQCSSLMQVHLPLFSYMWPNASMLWPHAAPPICVNTFPASCRPSTCTRHVDVHALAHPARPTHLGHRRLPGPHGLHNPRQSLLLVLYNPWAGGWELLEDDADCHLLALI